MGKYFLLQLKRMSRALPFIFLTLSILFICLLLVFNTMINSSDGEEHARFKLALVCPADDPYFNAGMDIVQSYDSSRFAIETVQLDEQTAKERLEQGLLDAYVVIPSGYIQDAMGGQLGALKYVSTVGAADLSMLFKEEITSVVSDIIIACEKGMYGIDRIAEDYDFDDISGSISGKVSLQYVDYIIERSDMYYIDELGIRDTLGLDGYLFSGLIVLIFEVILIPAGLYHIKSNYSLELLLKSKNIGPCKQVIAEYVSLLIVYSVPVILLCIGVHVFSSIVPPNLYRFTQIFNFKNTLQILSVICVIVAVGYLLFQLASEFTGGFLLYFFASLGLSFIAGCFYPTYFFPDIVQEIAPYIPQGICRLIINACITGKSNNYNCIILMSYSIVLLATAYFIRHIRIKLPKR